MSRVKHNALHRFSAGFNATVNGPDVPFFHPAQQGWKVLYEDFATPFLFSADSTYYEYTTIGSGTAVIGNKGVSIANSTTTINEGSLVQAITANVLNTESTKKFYMETSATLTAATMAGTEFFVGMTSDQGTTIGDFVDAAGTSWTFDDGFGIGKLDTDTAMSFYARQSDAEQSVSFGSTATTATRHTWGVYYDGATYYLYKDGALAGSTAKTVFNDDAAMGFAAFFKSGTAEAQSALVNYVLFAQAL
jgi:hypothetical protein